LGILQIDKKKDWWLRVVYMIKFYKPLTTSVIWIIEFIQNL
jgi:hypothetical protein